MLSHISNKYENLICKRIYIFSRERIGLSIIESIPNVCTSFQYVMRTGENRQ